MTGVANTPRWQLALLAWVLGGCYAQPPAAFPHVTHLTGIECGRPNQPKCPSCLTCHADVVRADSPRPPTEERCSACHRPGERRVLRTLAVPASTLAARSGLSFSHRDHLRLERVAGQCFGCHESVAETNAAPGIPPMATCLSCHHADFDQARCSPCHQPATLAQRVPQSFMRHDAAWPRRHASDATRARRVCETCHTQAWCTDCHNPERRLPMTLRRLESATHDAVHPLDFVHQHAIEAASRPGTCNRCHTPASCDGCHVLRGVSANRLGATNPHPVGWVGRDLGSRDFHGRAARRDPGSCAACHEQGPATNCIQCHRVGGPGGTPHPASFRSSRSRSDLPCRYCHAR
jgi:hypothetical protein